ncbi:MAG TPA: hypothetical protein DEP84_10115 [Chloroflexi bacterium]|nr:hypothetical protein [Chloroflexota bacterium]
MGHGDKPDIHGMLVFGEENVYFSHLPMFGHPHHDFQVLLQINFADGEEDLQATYVRDRRQTGERMYTFQPEPFILPDLVSSDPHPRHRSFHGTLFRGHFERGGEALFNTVANVTNIIHFRRFDPAAQPLPQLEYLLIGKGQERFFVHVITTPPDFDQVLSVKNLSHAFTDEELHQGLRVGFPTRANGVRTRIRARERVVGEVRIPEQEPTRMLEVELESGIEFYFEEGELQSPPTFAQTAEEEAAGF